MEILQVTDIKKYYGSGESLTKESLQQLLEQVAAEKARY